MAGVDELDKFVRKFVCLWQSGWEANLQVQAKAGNAFVSLHLGLDRQSPTLGRVPIMLVAKAAVEAALPNSAVRQEEKMNGKLEKQLNKLMLQKLSVK